MPDLINKYGIYRTSDGKEVYINNTCLNNSWTGFQWNVRNGENLAEDVIYYSSGHPVNKEHAHIVAYVRPYWEHIEEDGLCECVNEIAQLTFLLNRRVQLMKDIQIYLHNKSCQ